MKEIFLKFKNLSINYLKEMKILKSLKVTGTENLTILKNLKNILITSTLKEKSNIK